MSIIIRGRTTLTGGQFGLNKPYPFRPLAPTITNITETSFDFGITPGDGNPPTMEYAIQDVLTGRYISDVGTLGTTPFYFTAGIWSLLTPLYGLLPNVNYQMRAIARDPVTLVTTNGATVSVTTLNYAFAYIFTDPYIQDFGNVPVSTPSSVLSFALIGDNLDGTDVIVDSFSYDNGLQWCTFSTNPLGPFTTTLTFSGYGTSIPLTTVYYIVTPPILGLNQGEVNLTGGGVFTGLNLTGNGT